VTILGDQITRLQNVYVYNCYFQLLNFVEILAVQNIIMKECVKSVSGIVANKTFNLPSQFRLFHQCDLQNRKFFSRSGFQKCEI